MTYTEQLNQLTSHYNETIRTLKTAYEQERIGSGWNLSASYLRQQYSRRYDVVVREYQQQRHELLERWKAQNPLWARRRRILEWTFVIGILAAIVSCMGQLPSEEATPTAVMDNTEERYWNAENIPMPHLQDASQYVSNPDKVLSQHSVDRINGTLQRLDNELGIESVVIIVNHIENDDPFRMAQDVGNKYGVGKQDRGLVVVVGYQDHSVNMSPGKALEGDLTDAECHRLEQQYVVPAMRAGAPDSAMIYLTEAIYSTLQKKQLPQMSQLTSQSDELEDEIASTIGIYLLVLMAWCVVFLQLNRKYQWLALVGAVALQPNPFIETTHVTIGGGGFGRGGGFGGGGGGFGGSFGGGSFGGGGATSRW